jgi:hypothetical protein
MRSIHETVATADDPVAVGEVLENVSLGDLIPDRLFRSSA